MSTRRAGANDAVIGKNIYVYRLARRMSQTRLGEAIGVTFQQVQKYEKGTNRVGSARLVLVAQALQVPPRGAVQRRSGRGRSGQKCRRGGP